MARKLFIIIIAAICTNLFMLTLVQRPPDRIHPALDGTDDKFELTATELVRQITMTAEGDPITRTAEANYFATLNITTTPVPTTTPDLTRTAFYRNNPPDSFNLTATELVRQVTMTALLENITETAQMDYLATTGVTATPSPTRIPRSSNSRHDNSQENINLRMTGIVAGWFIVTTILWILLQYIKERRDHQKEKRKNVES